MKIQKINEDYTHNNDGVIYKGFAIVPFNYTLKFNGKSTPVKCVVLVLPESSKKYGMDIVVYPENEDGDTLNFRNVNEAKDYLDKYDGRLSIENKRNEIHLVVD